MSSIGKTSTCNTLLMDSTAESSRLMVECSSSWSATLSSPVSTLSLSFNWPTELSSYSAPNDTSLSCVLSCPLLPVSLQLSTACSVVFFSSSNPEFPSTAENPESPSPLASAKTESSTKSCFNPSIPPFSSSTLNSTASSKTSSPSESLCS
uniref:Uncharacterized protein n=1 Tax=Opuntia streptacantha TaxID=393608 RepID=A0A7C8YV36_OPUST